MKWLRRVSVLMLFGMSLFGLGRGTHAGEGGVKVGDKAPAFEAKDDQGKTWKSSDHVGKKIVVVYFFPAALTGGWTKQACGFRDDAKELADKGVTVVGVSGDEVVGQQVFKKVNNLNFTLLADVDGAVAKKFGVPTKKGGPAKYTFEGKEYKWQRGVIPARWTFVMDQNGVIVHKDTSAKAAEDSANVLKVVSKLKAQ